MATKGPEINDDGIFSKNEMAIRLPMFEGPLDLLLFLIRKNEVDIYDIPIESVTKQYLEVLHDMERLNLEVAGDFFVMAATLMYIKSRMLLPTNEQPATSNEDEEEDIDPRWELVQQLIEYKKFKEAAHELDRMIDTQQDYLPRIYKYRADKKEVRPLEKSDRIDVWNTFNLVLRRLAEQMTKGEIQDEQVSLADRMEYILELIKTRDKFTFTSLFEGEPFNLNKLVATFLAILELTRLKRLTVEQNDNFDEIECAALPEPRFDPTLDAETDDSIEDEESDLEASKEEEDRLSPAKQNFPENAKNEQEQAAESGTDAAKEGDQSERKTEL